MTIRFRRFIFWVFAAFFIIASIIISFLAQGYGFDFNFFRIVKTGGIFIKTSQSGAKIYINDKFIKETEGLLNYSRLVSGLVPGRYNVFVYKEGYYPWNKTIEVKSGLVAEIDYLLLFPLKFQKVKVADELISNVKFSAQDGPASGWKVATSSAEIISPDKNKKLYISNNKILIEYLKDEKEEPVKKIGETELISEYEPPIKFLDWLGDSEHIVWFSNNELSIAERDNYGGKRNIIKFYLNIASPVYFDRENSDFYFFENAGKKEILYKINLGV